MISKFTSTIAQFKRQFSTLMLQNVQIEHNISHPSSLFKRYIYYSQNLNCVDMTNIFMFYWGKDLCPHKNHTQMFIADLFIFAKTWKH